LRSDRPSSDGLPPPVLIEDAAGLRRLVERLARSDEIAVDTEADSFFHYQERVCLIQVSIEGADFLVDPLQGLDLESFGRVLADPYKVKVFHDGEYDVLILKREYDFSFGGLFDTRIAAAALGMSAPGLASVVEDRFGVTLDKSLQRSDWSARPLTARQIDYARLDTHYLLPLMHQFRRDLEQRGRTRIVEGECRRLESLTPPERSFEPDEFVLLKGARALRPMQLQVLRELFVLRDALARERDVPPFKVLSNANLLDLARSKARSVHQLASVPGLSPKITRRLGPALVGAIDRAHERGPLERLPRLPSRDGTGELSDEEIELHERLKAWRREEGQRDGIDSSLVLNRLVLLRLAQARPRSAAELERVEGLLDWQRERYGDALLELVHAFEADLASGRFVPGKRRRRSRG